MRGFEEEEKQALRRETHLVRTLLANDLAALGQTTTDWATWDATYEFVANHNEKYVKDHLTTVSIKNLGGDFMAFVDVHGTVVVSKTVDPDGSRETSTPQALLAHLAPGSPLVGFTDPASSCSGVLLAGDLPPFLVASRPILKAQGVGPVGGTLVIAQYLHKERTQGIADAVRLPVEFHRLDSASPPPGLPDIGRLLATGLRGVIFEKRGEHSISGYSVIRDIHGKPALVVRIEARRELYWRGRNTVLYAVGALAVAALVTFGLVLILLEKLVGSRLRRLERELGVVTANGDPSARVSEEGDDELGKLARAVNSGLAALERSGADLSKHALVFDSMDEAVIISSLDGITADVNDAFTRMYGYERAEVVGHKLNFVDPDFGDPALGETIIDLVSGGQTWRGELPILTKTGEQLWAYKTVKPMNNANGETVGLVFGPFWLESHFPVIFSLQMRTLRSSY
jgi:PAS domain S-box-containing protein